MKSKLLYAGERSRQVRTIPKASLFVTHLPKLKPGTPVVIFCRVSTQPQKANLEDSLKKLRELAQRHHCQIVKELEEEEEGWEEPEKRSKLLRAALFAKSCNGFILTETPDRFIRGYQSRRKRGVYSPPNEYEFRQLLRTLDGAKLATVVDPDAPPNEVRGFQTKRGQWAKGRYGGRPTQKLSPKQQRLRFLPEAITQRALGRSYRKIGAELGVHWSTVRDWIKRAEKSAHLAGASEIP